MKKINKYLPLSFLLLTMLSISSCKGDPTYPRTFTVKFVVDENCEAINDQVVKEGYLIKDVDVPKNNKDYIFEGWYLVDEEGNEEAFDIATYGVFDNITLQAKFIYPSEVPQNITLASDAFTKSITWIQNIKDMNDIEIRAKTGSLTYKYEYNSNFDKNIPVGSEVTYSDTYITLDDSLGTLTKIDDYHYKYTLTDPGDFYYGIEIGSKSHAYETAIADAIHFKGKGSKEDPYLVYNETDLKYLTNNNFDSNTYVQLMADVTIASIYSEKTNCVFNGHFDGSKSYGSLATSDNYSITLKNNSGLFMNLGEDAVVSNVNFKGSISGSDPSLGVVANYSNGTITSVNSVAVSVSSQGGKVNDIKTLSKGGSGGIVGTNLEKGSITNCTVSSARDNVISGNIGVGGVAGINYGRIYDMKCDAIIGAYNGNEISTTVANSYSGCVVGVNYGRVERIDVYNGKINTRRIDNGELGQGSNCVGGVVGYNAKEGLIDQCLFDGMRIVGDTYVGGIAGFNDGVISNCYTGRRLRSPSNTTVWDRRFISPVCGSYYVGGIAGKCGENSVIKNVFSTANVWSYQMKGYTIAERAMNCIGVKYNQHTRDASTYLGQKYGVPYAKELVGPSGVQSKMNYIEIDNSFIVNVTASWGLGYVYDKESEMFVLDQNLVLEYLDVLGEYFGFRESSSHGIRLMWEASVSSAADLKAEWKTL